MKRSSNERPNKRHERSDEESRYIRDMIGRYALVVSASVLTTLFLSPRVLNSNHNTPHTPEQTSSSAETEATATARAALENELKTAYEDLDVDHPRNTHRTVTRNGVKRGVVKLHISGAGENTDGYHQDITYDPQPTTSNAAPIHWESTAEEGDAVVYPRLLNFQGSKPTTLNYGVQLSVRGALSSSEEIKAVYFADSMLKITGSHGEIDKVSLIPRPDTLPLVEVQPNE